KNNTGTVKPQAPLRIAIKAAIPDNTHFEEDFGNYRLSKKPLIRYVLRVLEAQRSGSANPAYVPNPSKDVVNVEHILPSNPKSNWPTFTDEEAKAYLNRIGNLAL